MSDTESISSASLVDSNIEDSGSDDDASRFMLAPIATNRRSRSRASTYKHVRNWDSPVRRERDSTISISSSSSCTTVIPTYDQTLTSLTLEACSDIARVRVLLILNIIHFRLWTPEPKEN